MKRFWNWLRLQLTLATFETRWKLKRYFGRSS